MIKISLKILNLYSFIEKFCFRDMPDDPFIHLTSLIGFGMLNLPNGR